MKKEGKMKIDLIVLQSAVGFLLARESVRSNVSLDVLQEIFVEDFIHHSQGLDPNHPQEVLEVEVGLTQSTDHLFAVAKRMRAPMQS